jgi:hypothetical protein
MTEMGKEIWIDPNAQFCEDIAQTCYADILGSVSQSEIFQRVYALPGLILKVVGAGHEVANLLTAAFSHLRASDYIEAEHETLTWHIGDVSLISSAPEFPLLPTGMHELGNFNCSASGHIFIERRSGLVTVYNRKTHIVTSICDGAGKIENDVIAKPLLRFLMGILQLKGIHLAHSALVGLNGKGILVTGKGGKGKSTISSAALLGGLSFCADDFVALQRTGTGIVGHSLYATLLLHENQLPKHPHLRAYCRRSHSATVPKTVVILAGNFAGQTVQSLAIDAITVPHIVAGTASSLQPISRVEALRALTPTSVFSSPWRSVETARFLFDLATELPCYAYHSGSVFEDISQPVKDRYAK